MSINIQEKELSMDDLVRAVGGAALSSQISALAQ